MPNPLAEGSSGGVRPGASPPYYLLPAAPVAMLEAVREASPRATCQIFREPGVLLMAPDQDPCVTRASLFLRLLDPQTKEAAWREFVARYQPLIAGWCRRKGLQETDVEDITQAVLCKLVARLKTFEYDPSRGFRPYLRRMVENAIKDCWSDRAKRPGARGTGDSGVAGMLAQLHDSGALDDLAAEVSSQLELDSLLALAVKQVRAQVEPRTWNAYWQRVYEERSVQEVADRLGMRVASVYQAVSRVNKMLKQALAEPQGGEADGEERVP
jgi:RNA polymerase sigma-70 factor (ECF subfamily)